MRLVIFKYLIILFYSKKLSKNSLGQTKMLFLADRNTKVTMQVKNLANQRQRVVFRMMIVICGTY